MRKAIIILCLGAALAACSKGEVDSPSKTSGVTATSGTDSSKQNEHQITLAEEGYAIEQTIGQDEGMTIVELKKEGADEADYFGILDEEFNWVMRPTNEIVEMEDFHEGLAAAAVPETRAILTEGREGELVWGYVDPKGEWAIKPTYARVEPYSSGVAKVRTIEEDLDALTHSRDIVIDKKEKEIIELKGLFDRFDQGYAYMEEESEPTDTDDMAQAGERFLNGYLVTGKGIVDTKGNFTSISYPEGQWPIAVIDDKILTETDPDRDYDEEEEERTERLMVLDKKGNILHTWDNHRMDDYSDEEESFYDQVTHQGRFLVQDEEEMKWMDIDGNTYFKGRHITVSNDVLIITQYDESKGEVERTTFYDMDGKKVGETEEPINIAPYHGKYWVTGKEYAKLVDLNGKVWLDETKKIKSKSYSDGLDGRAPSTPISDSSVRPTSESPDFIDCLINIDTLKMVTYDELLAQ